MIWNMTLTTNRQSPLLQQLWTTLGSQQTRLIDLCLSFRDEQVQVSRKKGVDRFSAWWDGIKEPRWGGIVGHGHDAKRRLLW